MVSAQNSKSGEEVSSVQMQIVTEHLGNYLCHA